MAFVKSPPKIPDYQLEVAFPESEYATRLELVRETMNEKGLDVLLVTYVNNACYLTGYQTPLANWYVCIAVPIEGDLVAHVLDLELMNLYLHGWPRHAPVYSLEWWDEEQAADELSGILKEHGWADKRIGLEMQRDGCSAHFARTLSEQLPQATLIDASEVVLSRRVIKSPAELETMREAAILTDIGIKAALEEVCAGR